MGPLLVPRVGISSQRSLNYLLHTGKPSSMNAAPRIAGSFAVCMWALQDLEYEAGHTWAAWEVARYRMCSPGKIRTRSTLGYLLKLAPDHIFMRNQMKSWNLASSCCTLFQSKPSKNVQYSPTFHPTIPLPRRILFPPTSWWYFSCCILLFLIFLPSSTSILILRISYRKQKQHRRAPAQVG